MVAAPTSVPHVRIIRDALAQLVTPGNVFEVRIPKFGRKNRTDAGYFDDIDTAAAAIARYDADTQCPAIYVTLNPVQSALLARACNRIAPYQDTTTNDSQMTHRTRLLIDCDPVRPAGISSSEAELQAALERAQRIRTWLDAAGWPEPLSAASGNGGHLIYGLDVPNDDASTTLVQTCLQALAARFDDDAVTVDTSVYNASRITKVYGTMTRKGDSTPERPHRRSAILSAPDSLTPVPVDLLRSLAATMSQPGKNAVSPAGGARSGTAFVEEFLRTHSIAPNKEKATSYGTVYRLDTCPFCGESDNSAVITVRTDGKIGYTCQHNRCKDSVTWQDFRQHYEPGCYDRAADLRPSRPRSTPATPATLTPPTEQAHGQAEQADAPGIRRFTLRTERDLACIPPPRWLLPNELIERGYNLIYGQSGCGKTFYAIDMALRAAANGHPVLYVATEDLAGLRIRVQAWRQAYPEKRGMFSWVEMPEGINLADHRDVGELIATIGTSYDLVVVDTLREAHLGDENSSRDMALCNRAFQRIIRACETAVLVVHHSGLNTERERGSTALGGNVDLKFEISNDDGAIAVSCKKIKNGTMLPTRYYQLTPSGESAVIRPSAQVSLRDAPLTKGQTTILEFLALAVFDESGAKTTQIESGTGIRNGSLYRALSGLKSRGYIAQGAKGDPYSITVSGRVQLRPDYLPPPEPTPTNSHGSECGSELAVGDSGSDHFDGLSTTTEDSALQCPTPTTPSQLPRTTTVGDHSSPPTTTPTARKGGSGGSEWWESKERGDLFAEDERRSVSPPEPARQLEVTPGQASLFSTPHGPAALPDLPTDDQIDAAGRVACFDWLQAHGLDVTGSYPVEEMRAFIKDAVAVLRE